MIAATTDANDLKVFSETTRLMSLEAGLTKAQQITALLLHKFAKAKHVAMFGYEAAVTAAGAPVPSGTTVVEGATTPAAPPSYYTSAGGAPISKSDS